MANAFQLSLSHLGSLARISHQSRDKERVAGFGGERGRWIESWGALARVL